MRNPIFEPTDTSSLGRRSTETPAEFSTLTVEFRSSSLVDEMPGARVAAGASGTSGRIVTDRGAWATATVPAKTAADSPATASWAILERIPVISHLVLCGSPSLVFLFSLLSCPAKAGHPATKSLCFEHSVIPGSSRGYGCPAFTRSRPWPTSATINRAKSETFRGARHPRDAHEHQSHITRAPYRDRWRRSGRRRAPSVRPA